MSKIGRQQISQKLLNEIGQGSFQISVSETEPEGTAEGSLWLQTGDSIFEPIPGDGEVIIEKELIVANAKVSDDEPIEFNSGDDIWFDIEETNGTNV